MVNFHCPFYICCMLHAIPATPAHFEAILALQQQNLKQNISAEEMQEQGFVTVVHSLEELRVMHAEHPSIIVMDGAALAGYALVMPPACGDAIPVLRPMFQQIAEINYKGAPINSCNWYVMGQVCVAKAYRGKGVFGMLYHAHRSLLRHRYNLCVTEISTSNTRSQRAHEKVGFTTILTHRDAADEWNIVLWDWTEPAVE